VLKFGTEAQKREWLVPFARGEKLGCFGLTEPEAGSDAAAQKTTAVRKGDGYVINGSKNWITNGPVADAIVLFTMTDRAAGHRGITAFVVPTSTPGFNRAQPDRKMGISAALSCSIFFEDMVVPAKNLLGKEGDGFKIAMSTLDGGRIGIAAQATGTMNAALDASVRYARERTAFGQPIAGFQAIQFMLADMRTEADAARLLTLRAAALKDAKRAFTREASMAKLFASEAAQRAVSKAVQIHGGYGYVDDFPVERYYRDARVQTIYEGTSEIQRLVIARELLR
jgi:butyryl-CoA dehydrogenase